MRLSNGSLASLGADIRVPAYDRSKVTTGIVHIGPSHFSRGHLLRYIDDVLETDPRWGVTSISLKSPTARDTLAEQDYLYSLTERGADGESTRIIGSLQKVIVAQESPKDVLDALADPNVKLVTLTVTQQGYGHNPATGLLDFGRDDIKACLSSLDDPRTAVGYLVAALERRKELGAPPLTIMSCDNIPGNGTVLRNVVLAYAGQKSEELRDYIEDQITFPTTMVDRIVPSTTPKDVFNTAQKGFEDEWPIVTEGFRQWAIEDNFAGDMPDLKSVGAIVADDVSAFELMKIRMLNGAHMALGCVGKLAGYDYVHEAIADPAIRKFIDGFMREAAATLKPLHGVDYEDYKGELIKRLENPHMKDELVRLARNGTQKLTGRVLDTLKDDITLDKEYKHLAFEVAAYIHYLKGQDLNGVPFDIIDEQAIKKELQYLAQTRDDNPCLVMAASGLFDASLLADKNFTVAVEQYVFAIKEHGMAEAIERMEKTDTPKIHPSISPPAPAVLTQP